MTLFPLAVILSLFSLSGHEAAIDVLTRWTWPLIYFPALYLQKNSLTKKIFFQALSVSLFIACLYSYFIFFRDHNLKYTSMTRVASFWDILRWGYFCSVALTIQLSVLLRPQLLTKKMWRWVFVLFVMTLIALIFSNTRGAWFGALLGGLLVLITQRKSLKFYFTYILCVGLILLSSDSVREKLFSSFMIEKRGGQITSGNDSNAGRLHMWKVSWELYQEVPFFGVGFEHSREALKSFLSTKDPVYVQTYTGTEYSYNDQHSSYMTVLLQFGGIYFVILYGFILLTMYHTRKEMTYWPALVCTAVVYFFHSGIVSFEAVVLFGLCALALCQTSKVSSG